MVELINAIHIEFFHNQDHVSQGINGIITSNPNIFRFNLVMVVFLMLDQPLPLP